MGYVEGHLLPGESVMHQTHLHKVIFLAPALAAITLGAAAGTAYYLGYNAAALALLALEIVPLVALIGAYIKYTSSEFAVTDKRVIIKVGWVQRKTLETMLGKVEGISVDQGFVGRVIDAGTITVTGTGGTKEMFDNIAGPLEFRRQVQAQVSALESVRSPVLFAAADAVPRDERECPHCAERILTRARVCKHCGREVEPLPAT